MLVIGGIGSIFDKEEPPRRVTVPDVRGKSLSDATDDLDASGFSDVSSHDLLEDRGQWDDDNWVVLDQQPAAGSTSMSDVSVSLGVVKWSDNKSGAQDSQLAHPDTTEDSPPVTEQAWQRYRVEIVRCWQDEIGTSHAEGSVTNTDGESRSFRVSVEFIDESGVRLDDADDIIFDLAPGQVAKWHAVGIESVDRASCRVLSVETM